MIYFGDIHLFDVTSYLSLCVSVWVWVWACLSCVYVSAHACMCAIFVVYACRFHALSLWTLASRALSTTLQCVRGAADGRPVELLRKESLAGLAPAAANRVLSHAYAAVVPIAPLPYPPLPLSPLRPGEPRL
jgi:hypothetical protein